MQEHALISRVPINNDLSRVGRLFETVVAAHGERAESVSLVRAWRARENVNI